MRGRWWVIAAFVYWLGPSLAWAQLDVAAVVAPASEAQRLFYSGHYQAAATMAETLLQNSPADLSVLELRSSALLLEFRRLSTLEANRGRPVKGCPSCVDVLAAFFRETDRGAVLARERLHTHPRDVSALYFLGKLDLNYVWMQVGTLGRRTAWKEFREARQALDDAIAVDADHTRALVARAYIDYIVDTKVPWGVRWIVGGGDRERALATVERAAHADSEFFAATEARFARWDLQTREHNVPAAVAVAEQLSRDFPANTELRKFLDTNRPVVRATR